MDVWDNVYYIFQYLYQIYTFSKRKDFERLALQALLIYIN